MGSARMAIRRRRHAKSDRIGKKLGALMFSVPNTSSPFHHHRRRISPSRHSSMAECYLDGNVSPKYFRFQLHRQEDELSIPLPTLMPPRNTGVNLVVLRQPCPKSRWIWKRT